MQLTLCKKFYMGLLFKHTMREYIVQKTVSVTIVVQKTVCVTNVVQKTVCVTIVVQKTVCVTIVVQKIAFSKC